MALRIGRYKYTPEEYYTGRKIVINDAGEIDTIITRPERVKAIEATERKVSNIKAVLETGDPLIKAKRTITTFAIGGVVGLIVALLAVLVLVIAI